MKSDDIFDDLKNYCYISWMWKSYTANYFCEKGSLLSKGTKWNSCRWNICMMYGISCQITWEVGKSSWEYRENMIGHVFIDNCSSWVIGKSGSLHYSILYVFENFFNKIFIKKYVTIDWTQKQIWKSRRFSLIQILKTMSLFSLINFCF